MDDYDEARRLFKVMERRAMNYKETTEYQSLDDYMKKFLDRHIDTIDKYGYFIFGDDRFKTICDHQYGVDACYDCLECPHYAIGLECDRCERWEKGHPRKGEQ